MPVKPGGRLLVGSGLCKGLQLKLRIFKMVALLKNLFQKIDVWYGCQTPAGAGMSF